MEKHAVRQDGGLYLGLFHGRTNPKEQMTDVGTTGPVLGPFVFVHVTYVSEIQIGDTGRKNHYLTITPDNLVYYDGVYYGEFSIYDANLFDGDPRLQERQAVFQASKAQVPPPAKDIKHEQAVTALLETSSPSDPPDPKIAELLAGMDNAEASRFGKTVCRIMQHHLATLQTVLRAIETKSAAGS